MLTARLHCQRFPGDWGEDKKFNVNAANEILTQPGLKTAFILALRDGCAIEKEELRTMANIPTADELRRKAEECRAQALGFQIPESKAHLLEIAAEYERLAIRAEMDAERQRMGANNEAALMKWFTSA